MNGINQADWSQAVDLLGPEFEQEFERAESLMMSCLPSGPATWRLVVAEVGGIEERTLIWRAASKAMGQEPGERLALSQLRHVLSVPLGG